ncbi:MAG TPA: winged helix-turn-helix domain-containing protein [Anaerolineales bacterium]|nr:winged helix-turn-helix domain-containing protein [Anaerolineales bacterium]
MAIKKKTSPEIQWEFGTAYELFISLLVLHKPDEHGIRASWAAGVRSRIPAAERKLLEEVYPFIGIPLKWIHELPEPRDAISALWALKQIPPARRMIVLNHLDQPFWHPSAEETKKHQQYAERLLRITSARSWKAEDLEFFRKTWEAKHLKVEKEALERVLDWWSRPDELGEGFLSALQAYYQAFFAEEEKRLTPVLKAGLERAQALASKMSIEELFAELSQGVQYDEEFRTQKLILAPAFWTTPLILFERLDAETMLVLFGARPPEMSAIPGETVPDGLVRSLKALADPTRLKILFYLSHESLTPSELARRLHLRAPTVIHHLNELRLASLVELTVGGDEKRYAARMQAIETIFRNLESFLRSEITEKNK